MSLNANDNHQVHILHKVPENKAIFCTLQYALARTSWKQENIQSKNKNQSKITFEFSNNEEKHWR